MGLRQVFVEKQTAFAALIKANCYIRKVSMNVSNDFSTPLATIASFFVALKKVD